MQAWLFVLLLVVIVALAIHIIQKGWQDTLLAGLALLSAILAAIVQFFHS